MTDAITPDAATDASAVARALLFRRPETKCRFLFAADDPDGLVIAPAGPKGAQVIAQATARLRDAGRTTVSGAMLVDADADPVFCLADAPGPFLRDLAAWAARRVAAVPALGALQSAGAARLAAPPDTDAALAALSLVGLDVVREPELWRDLVPLDDASVAAILAARWPGERMWFWLSDAGPGDMVPLLLQPIAWDPNRDRLDGQIRRLQAMGAGDGVTGHAWVAEDGVMQFVSGALRPPLMAELADWVRHQAAACPDLARLAHCRFVRVEAGRVIEVLEDAALWSGIAAPPAPGTLAAAAASLAPGEQLWLWLTARAPGGGFLAVAPVADDPRGAAFRARIAGLYRRFPESHHDAVTATLTAAANGTLRLAWHGAGPGTAAPGLIAAVRQEPGLQRLLEAADAGGTA